MLRTGIAAVALMLAGMLAGEAAAQESWTHNGVTFAQRDGWCATKTNQDDGQGGTLEALELRPCGQEFPLLSAAVAGHTDAPLDVPALTAQAAEVAAQDTGKQTTAAIFKKQASDCTESSFSVDPSPIPGINAFAVIAGYDCPSLNEAALTYMRTLTGFAQQRNNNFWIVAFDYPLADLTDADKAMIQGAIQTITAAD